MKLTLISIIILLLVILSPCFSQTVVLSVSKSCFSSISVNGKATLSNGKTNTVTIQNNGTLTFQLNNPSNKNILINIRGTGNHTKLSINNFQNQFTDKKTVSTDARLRLTADGKIYSLNEPFDIMLGCSNGEGGVAEAVLNLKMQQPNNETAIKNEPLTSTFSNPEKEKEYKPGSAVYDALQLADNTNLSLNEYKAIMQVYFPNETIDGPAEALAASAENPFLKTIIDDNFIAVNSADTTGNKSYSGKSILSSLSLSSIGGLDVTGIADGLAKFLVKRAKEELSISFFQKLKKTLDSIPDLQTLFPATASLLSSAGDNVYDYKKYIQNLRESFKEDIGNLDDNLPGLIKNHKTFFETNHALAAALNTGCYFAGELKRQVHPGDILANYPVDFLQNENKDWSGSIQTLQLLSASFRDTSSTDSTYWVSIKYIRQLVNNKKAVKIYFGLLYQQALNNYDSVAFANGTLVNILDTLAMQYDTDNDYVNSYKLYIMRFAEKTELLNKMIKSYTKPGTDSLAAELYKKYFDAAVDLIDYTSQVGNLPLANQQKFIADLPVILSPYLDITRAVSNLVIDINRRNYSSAINHAVFIYDKTIVKPARAEAITAEPSLKDNLSKASRHTDNPVVDSFVHTKNALNSLVKYGGFMAAVSTAQSSDEVESAIEAFALPAGSSSVKRVSSFNVSVNAYAGLFYGIEKIKSFDTGNTKPNVYGVMAPIGIAASWGHHLLFFRTGNIAWSTSLYVSLIDLGAVAAFRFKDTVAEAVPTIKLRDIFSPGAFLSIGIPKTPVSFNAGAQAGPNLRKVSATANDYRDKIYWRYSISFCVDIPVFNLYTR